MYHNISVGKVGEEIAGRFLEQKGYKILERGFRSRRWGELDLVCEEGKVLVFVEVKTRISSEFGSPEESITYFKKRSLKRAVLYYCQTHPNCSKSLRMDVLSVTLNDDRKSVCEIKHYENAF